MFHKFFMKIFWKVEFDKKMKFSISGKNFESGWFESKLPKTPESKMAKNESEFFWIKVWNEPDSDKIIIMSFL